MSLLQKMLKGLEEGQDVWGQYRVPVGEAVDDFNNGSKYVKISKSTIRRMSTPFYPLYSKVDGEIVGGVTMHTSLAIVKFLEIFEECSTKITKARDEGTMPYEEIKKLAYTMRGGLKTLFCSLTIDEMQLVREVMIPAFDYELSEKGIRPFYSFFHDRAGEWLDEKLVMSEDVPNCQKRKFMYF